MKIKTIKIKNWRSIKDVEFEAQDLMVIIGQNNHGKSNILSALLFFFGEIKAQDLDFNSGSSELFIQIKFNELDDADKVTFKKYLSSDSEIVVRKSAYLGGSFDYKGYIENPNDEWLQEANAGAYTTRELASSLPFNPYIPSSGRISKQDIIDAQNLYIQNNRANLKFTFEPESTNFMGLKSVAKGIFGEIYFIPAVKEASDDFSSKDTSVFGKLYSEIVAQMSEHNQDWRETKQKLGALFSTLNKLDSKGAENTSRPSQLTEFENELAVELSSWGAEIDIEVSPPDIETVFRTNTQVWVNDGVRTDIKRKGHGLQRALTVALVHVISKKAQIDNEVSDSTETAEQVSRKPSKSRYFIFEEPELYLHPQAQRSLYDSFVSLSESGSQVILCTHSSGLIDVERYKSIYIVTKESESIGSKIRQCVDDLFEGNDKKDFNLSYWINPERGELFFAKKVILLEGATDKTVIPVLAKNLGVFRYDYTLIDCGSKDNIPLYTRLLNKFSIPYKAVYDRDHQQHKLPDAIDSADRSSKSIENEVISGLGATIVFENDIEEELGLLQGGKNKPYAALKHINSDGYVISESLKSKVFEIYDVQDSTV